MSKKFFFYGTLLPEVDSELTQVLHEKLELIGRGFVTGRLFAIPWDEKYYPALTLNEKEYQIFGNVYETKENFSDDDLKLLDGYEEYYPECLPDSEYVRQEESVSVGGGKEVANVYVYSKAIPTDALEITNGDFVKFLKEI